MVVANAQAAGLSGARTPASRRPRARSSRSSTTTPSPGPTGCGRFAERLRRPRRPRRRRPHPAALGPPRARRGSPRSSTGSSAARTVGRERGRGAQPAWAATRRSAARRSTIAGGFPTRIGRTAAPLAAAGLRGDRVLHPARVSRRPGARCCTTRGAVIWHRVPAVRARFAYFRARCYAEGLSKALVTRSVGATAAASPSERGYARGDAAPGRGRADVRAGLAGRPRRAGARRRDHRRTAHDHRRLRRRHAGAERPVTVPGAHVPLRRRRPGRRGARALGASRPRSPRSSTSSPPRASPRSRSASSPPCGAARWRPPSVRSC